MKTLFYYCYYRIAQGYRSFNDGDYLDWGYYILFTSFMFIAFSIAVTVCYVLDLEFTKKTVIWVAIPFLLLYVRTWFTPENRKMVLFKQLQERYKDEPHKKLKGWLVALYAAGTLILYFVMLAIFV